MVGLLLLSWLQKTKNNKKVNAAARKKEQLIGRKHNLIVRLNKGKKCDKFPF